MAGGGRWPFVELQTDDREIEPCKDLGKRVFQVVGIASGKVLRQKRTCSRKRKKPRWQVR